MRAFLFSSMMLFSFVSSAWADPYVGLEGNRYSLTLNNSDSQLYPQSTAGWNVHVGDRFGNVAAELGYTTSTANGNSNIDNLHLTSLSADGIFYVPIFGGLNFLLTGGAMQTNYGISAYVLNSYEIDGKYKSSNADVPVLKGNEFDWRAGSGFSFGLDEFEIRILARYRPLSMDSQAQNALSLDFGINFYL